MAEKNSSQKGKDIHFRFLTSSPTTEHMLSDSMRRCINEMDVMFHGDFQFSISEVSEIRSDIYPFVTINESVLFVLEGFTPPIYSDGTLLSGSPNVNPKMKELKSDSFLSLLYREQFVLRLTITVGEIKGKKAERFLSIVKSFQQNADMPGVTLLSVECSRDLDFNIEDFIPENSDSYTYQPVMGFNSRPPELFSLEDINIDSTNEEQITQFIMDSYSEDILYSHDDNAEESPPLMMGKSPLNIATMINITRTEEEPKVKLLGEEFNGRIWPTLIRFLGTSTDDSQSEEESFFLSRHLRMPSLDSVNQAFYLSRGFPASHFFGDISGAHYNCSLLAVKGSEGAFSAGLMLERDVSPLGRVEFRVGVELISDDGIIAAECLFKGGEAETEDYMTALLGDLFECENITVDDILDASEQLDITMASVTE
jgi:hypothetical protein